MIIFCQWLSLSPCLRFVDKHYRGGWYCNKHYKKITNTTIKERIRNRMATIRQKVREALLSKEEKLLREYGVHSDKGNLTESGRRLVLDYIWENDKSVRNAVVKQVQTVDEVTKKSK